MSAQIHVETGISTGTDFWLEKRVLRMGSDPQADICLPSSQLAPFAVTLEFREDSWRVYNRASEAIHVDEQPVASGATKIWHSGARLRLSDGTSLQLVVEGSPEPSPPPDMRHDGFATVQKKGLARNAAETNAIDKATGDSTKGSKSNSIVQLVVTALCVAGCAALLLWNQGTGTSGASVPNFANLVT